MMKIFDMKNIDGYESIVFTHIHFIRLNRTDALVMDLHFSHRLTQYPERAPKAGKNICL